MKYGKIIGGGLRIAPNPLLVGDSYVGNPPESAYLGQGYLPIDESCDPPEGYEFDSWVIDNGTIKCSYAPIPEVNPETTEADSGFIYEKFMEVVNGNAETGD